MATRTTRRGHKPDCACVGCTAARRRDEEQLSTGMTPEQERASMENDLRARLFAIEEALKKRGMSLEDVFETPPNETTVTTVPDPGPMPMKPRGRQRPGTVVGDGVNAYQLPYTQSDLDEMQKTTFTPQPIPGMVHPIPDETGNPKIFMNVNGVGFWLTCGVPNTVSIMCYDAYMVNYNEWRRLEEFKRKGPQYAPWGERGPDGRPAWLFTPGQYFYMDEDGRALSPSEAVTMMTQQTATEEQ